MTQNDKDSYVITMILRKFHAGFGRTLTRTLTSCRSTHSSSLRRGLWKECKWSWWWQLSWQWWWQWLWDDDGDHNGDDYLPGIFWDASSLLFWVRPTSTIGPQEGRRLESSGLHSLTFIVFEYQHLNTKMTRSNLFRHGGLIPWDDDLDICVKEQVGSMMMA